MDTAASNGTSAPQPTWHGSTSRSAGTDRAALNPDSQSIPHRQASLGRRKRDGLGTCRHDGGNVMLLGSNAADATSCFSCRTAATLDVVSVLIASAKSSATRNVVNAAPTSANASVRSVTPSSPPSAATPSAALPNTEQAEPSEEKGKLRLSPTAAGKGKFRADPKNQQKSRPGEAAEMSVLD